MRTPAYSSNTTSISRRAHYGITFAALVTGLLVGAALTGSLLSRRTSRVQFAKEAQMIAISGASLEMTDRGQRDKLRALHERILTRTARQAAARAVTVDRLSPTLAPLAKDVALTEAYARKRQMNEVAGEIAVVRKRLEETTSPR